MFKLNKLNHWNNKIGKEWVEEKDWYNLEVSKYDSAEINKLTCFTKIAFSFMKCKKQLM